MYLPTTFKAYEVVDMATYTKYGEQSFQFFNPLALQGLQAIRNHFGVPVRVNDWKSGGTMQWRGLRTLDCLVGAKLSQHRLGGAFDCDIKGVTAEEARLQIIQKKGFGIITCLEDDVNWLHFDVRNIALTDGKLLIVKP